MGKLSEAERAAWSSPQSCWLRCPVFHPKGDEKVKALRQPPMSVNQLLRLPGAQAAQLLLDRAPTKAWAIWRGLHDLVDGGSAPRPPRWTPSRNRHRRT